MSYLASGPDMQACQNPCLIAVIISVLAVLYSSRKSDISSDKIQSESSF